MAEAPKPKYDSLPGIDTSQDVYETPDLDHDTSTVQASTAVSESEGGDSEEEDEDEESAVRHQRLQTDQARSRFQPSRVDARGVDFSDNISAQHRSYRTSTRGARRRGEILGDDSDEEKESFGRKLIRLKREVHELEHEFEGRLQSGDKNKIEERDHKEIIELISDKVDTIYAARRGGVRGAEPILDRTITRFNNYPPFDPSRRITKAIEMQPPLPGTQIQKSQLDFVLNQAADFDARMTKLENALGLNGNTMPDIGDRPPFPVFTTMEKLEQITSTLAEASSGNLDAVSQNIKKLIGEAEELKQANAEAARLAEAGGTPASKSTSDTKGRLDAEQEAKVNALYGTLPAIDKLSPLLPIVLERIRTLRLIHTAGWQADEILTELEDRQSQQEDEIKKWEISLKATEDEVKACEKAMHTNMKVVGDWVKNLEGRMEKLALVQKDE